MAKTVVGLFDTRQEAQDVVQELVNNGFARNDIGLLANNASGEFTNHTTSATNTDNLDAGAAAGRDAVTGAAAGGTLGLLVGLGSLLIPGVGPVIAAGPLATVLGLTAAGAGAGALAGGIVGALTHLGVPEEDANYYAEGVRRGGTLVTVKAEDASANKAYDILQRNGAADLDEHSADWRKEGWTSFDTNAQPYTAQQVEDYRRNRVETRANRTVDPNTAPANRRFYDTTNTTNPNDRV